MKSKTKEFKFMNGEITVYVCPLAALLEKVRTKMERDHLRRNEIPCISFGSKKQRNLTLFVRNDCQSYVAWELIDDSIMQEIRDAGYSEKTGHSVIRGILKEIRPE